MGIEFIQYKPRGSAVLLVSTDQRRLDQSHKAAVEHDGLYNGNTNIPMMGNKPMTGTKFIQWELKYTHDGNKYPIMGIGFNSNKPMMETS